ncbi:MAG: thioredoxin family protein [Candidatus Lernaella stagnicola]|nr:thioredoxin family protein [Candidatus Lernaella stagnicola]
MKIEVLGIGCPKCKKLYEEAAKAVAETGVSAKLIKVEKLDDIMRYGVMVTPTLVIDGQVKSSGRVVKAAQIAGWLLEAAK